MGVGNMTATVRWKSLCVNSAQIMNRLGWKESWPFPASHSIVHRTLASRSLCSELLWWGPVKASLKKLYLYSCSIMTLSCQSSCLGMRPVSPAVSLSIRETPSSQALIALYACRAALQKDYLPCPSSSFHQCSLSPICSEKIKQQNIEVYLKPRIHRKSVTRFFMRIICLEDDYTLVPVFRFGDETSPSTGFETVISGPDGIISTLYRHAISKEHWMDPSIKIKLIKHYVMDPSWRSIILIFVPLSYIHTMMIFFFFLFLNFSTLRCVFQLSPRSCSGCFLLLVVVLHGCGCGCSCGWLQVQHPFVGKDEQ